MLFQYQKILFQCIDEDYPTNIKLSILAKYFKYFESLVDEFKNTEVDCFTNPYFIFECELTKKYVKYLIDLLFNSITTKDINYYKLLYFMIKYEANNYDSYLDILIPDEKEDFIFFEGCDINFNECQQYENKNIYPVLYKGVKLFYYIGDELSTYTKICSLNFKYNFSYEFYKTHMLNEDQFDYKLKNLTN